MDKSTVPQDVRRRSSEGCILLVDDNSMDVELTLDAFSEAGLDMRIEVAGNGRLALDYLFGVGDFSDRHRFPLPRLILLDLKMPGIDGFEVLRQIKGTPALKRIPVIMLTSSREEGDLMMSYDIGANSYLVKPVSFNEFLDIVKLIDAYWFRMNITAATDGLSVPSP